MVLTKFFSISYLFSVDKSVEINKGKQQEAQDRKSSFDFVSPKVNLLCSAICILPFYLLLKEILVDFRLSLARMALTLGKRQGF